MTTKKFTEEQLIEALWDDEFIEDSIVDQRRWVTVYDAVYPFEGSFYRVSYELDSTESQESEPFDYSADKDGNIELTEIHKVKVEVESWRPV